MTSEYSDIFSRFYLTVTDYNLAGLDEKIVEEMLTGWMKSVLSQPYVRRLFSSLINDEDMETIEYELKFPISDNDDQEFIEEIVAIGMVIEWLKPKYYSVLNTAQFFSNSDQKWYSQANHMTELREMYHKAKNDLRKIIRDRGYIYNSYLNNGQ